MLHIILYFFLGIGFWNNLGFVLKLLYEHDFDDQIIFLRHVQVVEESVKVILCISQ